MGTGVTSLSGRPVLAVVVLLVVGVAATTVLVWPRFAGSSRWHLVARLALLTGGHLAVLLATAVLLNDQYQFFSSWRDLAGALHGSRHSLESASAGAAVPRPGAAPSVHDGRAARGLPRTTGVLLSTTGRLRRYRLTGGASGITADVYVELPRSSGVATGPRMPVLETFAGYPADPRQWLGAMDLQRTLNAEVASGDLAEPLVVLPTVEVPPGTDTECTDSGQRGGDVETWLAQDVPGWVATTFPVASTREGWATMGLSTGGFCAALIAMHHPDAYAAGISFGGYYRAELPTPVAAGRNAAQLAAYDLVEQARTAPPAVSLWVMTSATDRLSYRSTQDLLHAARAPLSVHVDTLLDAGHRTSVYVPLVAPALHWLVAAAPGFSPPSAARR